MESKVGILYICTGRYWIFWEDFFKSCEKYFLPGIEKEYFVFTDAKKIFKEKNANVHKIYQQKLKFPGDTLMRFDMFLRERSQLEKMEYLFFFNANLMFMQNITPEDFFPGDDENGLIGYLHFAFYDKNPEEFLYERNPISTAYIEPGKGKHYYQGCVIGGQTSSFIKMAEVLNQRIKKDLEKDFIAVWWDESHLNYYLLDKKVKILHPGYCFPEVGFNDLPFEKKAIARNKSQRGGVNYLRGQDNSVISKLKFYIKRVLFHKKFSGSA
ncbi:MAG: family 6 glucosyltransferase [Chitinophagaceae bacterium]